MKDLVWFALGAAGALATDVSTRGMTERRRIALAAVGLVGAAAIYPAARRRSLGSPSEQATMAVAVVFGAVALSKGERAGRRIIAAACLARSR